MGFKLFLVVCLAVIATQGCDAKHIGLSEERGLIEEFEKLIHKVTESIREFIAEASAKLREFLQEKINSFQQDVEKFKELIKNIVDDSVKEIHEIVHKAQELGVDINECLDDEHKRITELSEKTHANFQNCVDVVLETVVDIELATGDLLKSVWSQVESLVQEFNACDKLSCRISVVAKVTEEVPKITKEVNDSVSNSVNQIGSAIAEATKCAADNYSAFQTEVKAIVKEVTDCIAAKINAANKM